MGGTLPQLINLIEAQRLQQGLSIRGAAMYIGVSNVTLYEILTGKNTPSAPTCLKLAYWLKMPPPRILGMAGHQEMAAALREPMPEISAEASEVAFDYDDLRDPAHRTAIRQQLHLLRDAERKWEYRTDEPRDRVIADTEQ